MVLLRTFYRENCISPFFNIDCNASSRTWTSQYKQINWKMHFFSPKFKYVNQTNRIEIICAGFYAGTYFKITGGLFPKSFFIESSKINKNWSSADEEYLESIDFCFFPLYDFKEQNFAFSVAKIWITLLPQKIRSGTSLNSCGPVLIQATI